MFSPRIFRPIGVFAVCHFLPLSFLLLFLKDAPLQHSVRFNLDLVDFACESSHLHMKDPQFFCFAFVCFLVGGSISTRNAPDPMC